MFARIRQDTGAVVLSVRDTAPRFHTDEALDRLAQRVSH